MATIIKISASVWALQLYQAAGKVFQIPEFEALRDRRKLRTFFARWFPDQHWQGPKIYFDLKGLPTLIVTEASRRQIHLRWEMGNLTGLEIEFPNGGSIYAASQIVAHLNELTGNRAQAAIEVLGDDGSDRTHNLDNLPDLS